MKVSTSWINNWLCRTMSDQEIVQALERAGLEVEQFIAAKSLDEKIVVALVKKVIQHPGADKLRLVDVETGEREVRVVCGAPNVREGIKVALAQVGTTLPSGDKITAAKLRGEVSEGMLCSELELGLGDDHDGILEIEADIAPGTVLCDMYKSDGIVDLKTHANRFDLLSVAGLAREVGAMTGTSLRELPKPVAPKDDATDMVGPLEDCSRFMMVSMKVAQGAPFPDQMAAHLMTAGVRSISPIVDVTNYVNLELGQPLHAYDASKVKLPLAVRHAKAGEKLVTLDGVERELTELDLVVADARGPVGLAGLMGGRDTEVDENTTEILLEAATFDGAIVRKMAKRHGLRTEASARFERGLPVDLPPYALSRAVELLQTLGGKDVTAVTDAGMSVSLKVREIRTPLELLNRLLGYEVSGQEAVEALAKLQIEARMQGEDIVISALPWWRTDMKEAQDVVEEIVRVLGLDRIPSKLPAWQPQRVTFDRMYPRQRLLRQVLYAAGLFEVMTYSFQSEEQLKDLGLELTDHLKLKNPMSIEQAYLRSTLLPSHLMVLGRNRAYAKEIGYYELSKVFIKGRDGDQPDEPQRLGVTMLCAEDGYRRLKGVLDLMAREFGVELQVSPIENSVPGYAAGRVAAVKLGRQKLGYIGQLEPARVQKLKVRGEVAYLEIDVNELLMAAVPRQYEGLERFPHIARDVAVVLKAEVTWQQVADSLDSLGNTRVEFVSDYYGEELPEGHKSMALRLTLSHPDRTPTEAEAQDMEQKAVRILTRKFGASIRA